MTKDQKTAIEQWLSKPAPKSFACSCIGPREGDPVCSCAMRWVEKVNGKFYKIIEHRSPKGVTHSAIEFLTERQFYSISVN